jgi:CRP/FNR family cyclic AMP-dependent transcriptional regulator
VDLNRLRRSTLFVALDDETVADVLTRVTTKELQRGEVLFRQDDPADQLWFLGEGRIKLTRVAADQRETLLAILAPGEVFGETCLLEGTPRVATATALLPSTVAVVGRAEVDLLLATHPDVIPVLLQVLARRLRSVNELLTELAFRDVAGRVAKALVDLSLRFGQPSDGGLRVAHGLTQEELAQLVGASREAVNKALSDFAARGWLHPEPRGVQVRNLERLRRRAHLAPTPSALATTATPLAAGQAATPLAAGQAATPPAAGRALPPASAVTATSPRGPVCS